jgi:hypothetical protein
LQGTYRVMGWIEMLVFRMLMSQIRTPTLAAMQDHWQGRVVYSAGGDVL